MLQSLLQAIQTLEQLGTLASQKDALTIGNIIPEFSQDCLELDEEFVKDVLDK